MKLKTFRIRNNIIKILQKWPSFIAMYVVSKLQLHVYAIYPWWLIDNMGSLFQIYWIIVRINFIYRYLMT